MAHPRSPRGPRVRAPPQLGAGPRTRSRDPPGKGERKPAAPPPEEREPQRQPEEEEPEQPEELHAMLHRALAGELPAAWGPAGAPARAPAPADPLGDLGLPRLQQHEKEMLEILQLDQHLQPPAGPGGAAPLAAKAAWEIDEFFGDGPDAPPLGSWGGFDLSASHMDPLDRVAALVAEAVTELCGALRAPFPAFPAGTTAPWADEELPHHPSHLPHLPQSAAVGADVKVEGRPAAAGPKGSEEVGTESLACNSTLQSLSEGGDEAGSGAAPRDDGGDLAAVLVDLLDRVDLAAAQQANGGATSPRTGATAARLAAALERFRVSRAQLRSRLAAVLPAGSLEDGCVDPAAALERVEAEFDRGHSRALRALEPVLADLRAAVATDRALQGPPPQPSSPSAEGDDLPQLEASQGQETLKRWLYAHFNSPYPTDEQKEQLAVLAGCTRRQVQNWFINARVRYWRPLVWKLAERIEETQGLKPPSKRARRKCVAPAPAAQQ